ncbi:hypothetical protein PTTG_28815 [Puccinia triticina 1-1 BBBD Race 1]|uniref:DUF4219 domain-containing protein n=1 Tax=Puccinia triticina (isolate 1-1 / race 1 (BBBD)) TaxID=630390 RepID=A0A180G920_PUCT1|nr:hypothetical protein PTTG_28815 [Puccinia triticina 1-1 BBBD Race 1]
MSGRSTRKSPAVETSTTTSAQDEQDYIKCPILVGENYPIWQRKIKVYLKVKKLLECIEQPMDEEPDDDEEDKYARAAHILGGHVSDDIYNHIITDKNILDAYAIWTELNNEYASSSILAIY